MAGLSDEYVESDPCVEPALHFDQFAKSVHDMSAGEAYSMYLMLRELRCGEPVKLLTHIPDDEKIRFVFSGHRIPEQPKHPVPIPLPSTGWLLLGALLLSIAMRYSRRFR